MLFRNNNEMCGNLRNFDNKAFHRPLKKLGIFLSNHFIYHLCIYKDILNWELDHENGVTALLWNVVISQSIFSSSLTQLSKPETWHYTDHLLNFVHLTCVINGFASEPFLLDKSNIFQSGHLNEILPFDTTFWSS